MAKIIGIRYIGKKESSEDTVTDTAAIWVYGQVHNFAGVLAKQLLIHTDSFEEAPLSIDGETYMSGKIGGQIHSEPVVYTNLGAMSADQMAHYVHREFSRRLDVEGKTEDQLRSEVQRLMTMATMDEIGERGKVSEFNISIPATKEESEAITNGTLKVRFVPTEAIMATSGLTKEQARLLITQHSIDEIYSNVADVEMLTTNAPLLREAYDALLCIADILIEVVVPAKTDDINKLESMSKAALLELAAERSIEVSDKASIHAIRKILIAESA